MKKLFIIICLSAISFGSQAQNKTLETINKDVSVKDTTINNKSFKLYTGAKGGKYIIVVSKTGNSYKRYFKKN